MSRRIKARAVADGFPGYVRGWCCKASEGSMQQGYRDVGYLLAPRLKVCRPVWCRIPEWRERLGVLRSHVLQGKAAHISRWCWESYPRLMELIPKPRRRSFVAGLAERLVGDLRSDIAQGLRP